MSDEYESVDERIEEHNEKKDEVEFFKMCKLSENNHIHHFHKDLPNPKAFYTPHKFVSVTEIFFDLVFVGVAGNLAHGLRKDEQTWDGFFHYMIILLTFWKDYTLNQSLFSVGDFIDKCSAFFYGLGIIGCATTSFYGPLKVNGTAFGIIAIYVCICQLCLNLRGLYGMYHAINHTKKACHREESTLFCMKMQLFKNTGMIVLWMSFAIARGSREGLIWINMIFPIIFDLAFAIYLKDIIFDFNPNIHHYNERFEAIVLIMLGETVLGIIPDIHEAEKGCVTRTIGCIVMGYVTMFLYKIFHFDVEEYEGHTHAVYIGGIRKFMWTYAMIFECVGIVLFGASIGELIEGVMQEHAMKHIHKSNVMMAVGMSVALAGNMISRLCHKRELEEFEYAWELWLGQNVFQFVAICLIIPLPHLFSEALLSKVPWVRSIYVSAIIFILNCFFFVDEILEYRYLKNLIDFKTKHETKSIEVGQISSSPKRKVIPIKDLKEEKNEKKKKENLDGNTEIENHGSKEIENL